MGDERERLLFEQAQEGDKDAREKLIVKNAGLVHHVLKRYAGRGYDCEDLFQLGMIGLMKAVERFDINYGVCFSTYAVPMIAGEIRRFMRDDGMVKVSRGIKENLWKIQQTREKILQEQTREPTIQEISNETGILPEDIVVALESGREVESIYKTVYQSDGSELTLLEQLEDKQSYDEKLINRIMVDELLKKLNIQERTLIQLRFYEDKTQMQVAEYLGMSQVQVSRLEKKILLRMRAEMINSKSVCCKY